MEFKTLKTLEYNKILEKLSCHAKNERTIEMINNLTPSANFREVQQNLLETDAGVTFILKYSSPEILRTDDIKGSIKRLMVGGGLSMSELLNIAKVLKCARILKKYTADQVGILNCYFEDLAPNKPIEDRIFTSILSNEEMADTASHELSSIRRKIKNAGAKIKSTLDSMIKSPHYQKFLQDPIVTMRNDRYVLPVKSEHRSEISGIVHDMSASGGTAFIEPAGVVSANNDLSELAIKEKEEIERILLEISGEVAEISEELGYTFETIIHIDFVFSKAKLALDMKATLPNINDDGKINIKRGRHPLIDPHTVVPIDVYIGYDFDSLIVTGPNTGGKTVVLKTIGLFCLMTQSGLHIPVADGSEMAVFNDVFADIGDEQSIEQSLSTFSSHIKNIVDIVGKLNDKSLVLFDELGAGTDPVEGAALATSIIESIRGIGARIVATTHYSELKLYALSTVGVENASCEFDVSTLSPTYKLLIGVPGKSNAFAISQKLGLPADIIERSREMLSGENIKFEDILSNIEKNRQTTEKAKSEQEEMKLELETLKAELEKERAKINKQKDKIYDSARQKAEKIILKAQNETEQVLSELKEAQKSSDKQEAMRATQELRKDLGLKLKSNVAPKSRQAQKPKSNTNINSLKLGSTVLSMDLNDKGTILSINKKDETAVIQVGIMKITSPINNLIVLEDEMGAKPSSYIPSRKGSRLNTTPAKTEVDLRGMSLDEAENETDKFLDEASLAGVDVVSIIHGKGTGVLRKGIHDMLRHHPQVKKYRLGKYGEGENGVTIVELK
ncbi:MAG: endonuclease MutS2 [Oscillospiraceae bacterium]